MIAPKNYISQLPYEMLYGIFKNLALACQDLIQVQLVCRTWSLIAQELLYQSIELSSEKEAAAFIHAITTAGHLVKSINVDWLSMDNTNYGNEVKDPQDILGNVITYCPNVTKIKSCYIPTSFYIKLMCAAYQGYLSYLERLPKPYSSDDIESYTYTALAFNKSLKKLHLYKKRRRNCELDTRYKMYDMLVSKLHEFRNLRKLKIMIDIPGELQGITAFDAVLDSSPKYVEAIHIKTRNTTVDNSILKHEFNNNTLSKTYIKTYRGCSDILFGDESLLYFMQKFPNLNRLTLEARKQYYFPMHIRKTVWSYSENVLWQFYKYIIKIPCVNVSLDLEVSAIPCWKKLLEEKKDVVVSVDYYQQVSLDYTTINNQTIGISQDNSKITTAFPYELNIHEPLPVCLPHTQLIEVAGHLIQYLGINDLSSFKKRLRRLDDNRWNRQQVAEYENVLNGQWLDHIFQECTALKSLFIYAPGSIQLDNQENNWSNDTLEKLEIGQFDNTMHVSWNDFFKAISQRLRALNYLYMNCPLNSDSVYVVIDMPNTSFDMLFWEESIYSHHERTNDWKVCIRLTLDSTKYLVLNANGEVLKSTVEQHEKSRQTSDIWLFDITCKSIRQFKLAFVDFCQVYDLNHAK